MIQRRGIYECCDAYNVTTHQPRNYLDGLIPKTKCQDRGILSHSDFLSFKHFRDIKILR